MTANGIGRERPRGHGARSPIPAAAPPFPAQVPIRAPGSPHAARVPISEGPAPEYGPIAGLRPRNATRNAGSGMRMASLDYLLQGCCTRRE